MTQLRYYTSEVLEELRRQIPQHLDWYYGNNENALPPVAPIDGVRESRLRAPELADRLTMADRQPSTTDIDNALAVYKALSELTPHQASIERMWVHLCHFDCRQYVTGRWLNKRPEKDDTAARNVRNHFFAVGNRALIRDNGVSRLWWLGKIAHDADPEDPREFLTIILHRQDVRSALIERPAVSMNRRVLRGIYRVMRDHWADGGALFERETFRRWMVALNRRGGVVLLDALPQEPLDKLLRIEADHALKSRLS